MAKALLFLGLLAIGAAAVAADVVFYEPFDGSWESRWTVSGHSDYQGHWKHEKSEGHEDYGLLVSEPAKKHGIAATLPKSVDLKDDVVVLQYDVRLQKGLECGGAYLKFLLPQEAGWTPGDFSNESPYSIMFGPDKCGATNKVHFIYKHKGPKSDKHIEHHLKYPPSPVADKLSHVYTAVIYPNNTLKILVDGKEEKSVDLLSSDFEPAVIPPKTIPDPDDKKPEDWDERAKIPDPEATKPEDWDEDAPLEIEDVEAVKPDDWLDNEPDEVDDPEASKPADWDDEEDGEWEPPKISNPKCEEASGCGEWKRPMKRNPDYKGKWYPPMIDNPAYKGIWAPKQIPNPEYFELDRPDLEPISAIGIEIWTMQDGILFDNILVATDEAVAAEYRETKWKPKYEAEKEKQKIEEATPSPDGIQAKMFEYLRKVADIPALASQKEKILDLLEKAEKFPTISLSAIALIPLVVVVTLFKILFGGKKSPPKKTKVTVEKSKKEDISSPDDSKDKAEDDATGNEIEKEGEGARQRRTRRES
ncbi:calnexin homolog [Selaginella moellendorffii]|uniref:calnexin homolog n=1 Tax=Selaginella moellendorffii TaxID=88036 RepID=UPI000D1C9DB9|nr:calnexin homolog [Selaginella moellendorffii]|eukprot:XP_024545410.1 calnexin homolog [Selaginella moellendorffii]